MEPKLDIEGFEVKAAEVGKQLMDKYVDRPMEEALALAFFHGMNWGIERVLHRVKETQSQCVAARTDLPPQ